MDVFLNTLVSNEWSGDPLPTELLWATKKVKNKEDVEDLDQEMKKPKPVKTSFKEIMLGSRGENHREDKCHSLVDEEEITLLEDDVHISLEGSYP